MASPISAESAREVGLRYTSDREAGIRRVRRGKGFSYLDPTDHPVRDARIIERIDSLAIPPAWSDVWICARENGHLQATGRDQKGRKQAIYHPKWRSHRDETKFSRLLEFGERLPIIRTRVEEDLRSRGWPKRKVAALVVKLLETTLIRIGNRRYVQQNGSYGLTTLESDHVEVGTTKVAFRFKGKSGKYHEVELKDRRLARLVRACQDLPGQALIQYLNSDGEACEIESGEVNDYLREVSGDDFTAKHFRTWSATIEAMRLRREDPAAKLTSVVREVAARLGNTPTVCRASYIHPRVLEEVGELPHWVTMPNPRSTKAYSDPVERIAVEVLLRDKQ